MGTTASGTMAEAVTPIPEACANDQALQSFIRRQCIFMKGQTGWTSAYADRERGGGGLMS